MLLVLTPYCFLFFLCYFLCLLGVVFSGDFWGLWMFMEFMTFFFLGLALSFERTNFSALAIYFIIQSVASFGLFISVTTTSSLSLVFVIFKLGMFPFMSWFFYVVYSLHGWLFYLALTFNKVPVYVMIISSFVDVSHSFFLWVVLITTLLVGAVMALTSSDIFFLLVSTSVSNNSWVMLSLLGGWEYFLSFCSVYFLTLFLILSLKYCMDSMGFFYLLLSISGFPPFPMFFVKLMIILSMLEYWGVGYVFLVGVGGLIVSVSYLYGVFYKMIWNFVSFLSV